MPHRTPDRKRPSAQAVPGASRTLRRIRLELGETQAALAAALGVPENSYRVWESGRRPPPRAVLARVRRLREMAGGLRSLSTLAATCGVHVRTLRKAAQDGRLEATFSTRTAFGGVIAFATRAAVDRFRARYYRRTSRWNRPQHGPLAPVPPDYDQQLKRLRGCLRWSQATLAEHLGLAGKATVYQWESRRRRPSAVIWKRILTLEAPSTNRSPD